MPVTDSRDDPTGWRLVSVIMPSRNAAATIEAQLQALQRQTYEDPWELLVIDHGSTDETPEIVARYSDIMPVRRIDAAEADGMNALRDIGFLQSKGDLLIYCDADDVASEGWLAALADAARYCDIVGGQLEYAKLNREDVLAWHDPRQVGRPLRGFRFLTYAPGGSYAIHRPVLEELRWSPESWSRSSDIQFSWRAHLEGIQICLAPDAVMSVRLRETVPDTMRQWFRYGLTGPHLYRRFRNRGMPRSSAHEVIGAWGRLLLNLGYPLSTEGRRGYWLRVLALRSGRVLGSIRERVVFL